MELRRNEIRKWRELKLPFSYITIINLTVLKGGGDEDVVPEEMIAYFSLKSAIDADCSELEENRYREKVGCIPMHSS